MNPKDDKTPNGGELVTEGEGSLSVVKRSSVPVLTDYRDYRKYLRLDFWFSCAYCTMTEYEAQALRFTIDHYEPRRFRKDISNEYSNLMWCCDTCNIYKGDRYPSDEARAIGHRFFRPDQDVRPEHFESNGVRLEGKTNVGRYSIDAIELNRGPLMRLRQIRKRILDSNEFAAHGVAALRKFPIDRLPAHLKARAAVAIHRATAVKDKISTDIDDVLLRYAKSDVLSDDEADLKGRSKESAAALKRLDAMYPGALQRLRKARKKKPG